MSVLRYRPAVTSIAGPSKVFCCSRRTDRPGTRSSLPRRKGLGTFYRRSGSSHRPAQTGHRVYALGQLRPTQGRHGRPAKELHSEERTPLPAIGPSRLFRVPPLQPSQPISDPNRTNPHRLVIQATDRQIHGHGHKSKNYTAARTKRHKKRRWKISLPTPLTIMDKDYIIPPIPPMP